MNSVWSDAICLTQFCIRLRKPNVCIKRRFNSVLCGDVGQLPCVVTEDEATWLVHKYNSLHYMFFESKRYQSLPIKHFLLEKESGEQMLGNLCMPKIMRHIHDGDNRVLSLLDDRVVSEKLTPPGRHPRSRSTQSNCKSD